MASIELFLLILGFFLKMICCMLDQFFLRHIDEKYRSATVLFVLI